MSNETPKPSSQEPFEWRFLGSFLACCLLLGVLILLLPFLGDSYLISNSSAALWSLVVGSLWGTPVVFSIYLNFAVTAWWKRWCIALAAGAALFLFAAIICVFILEDAFILGIADVVSKINSNEDLSESRFRGAYVVIAFLSILFSAPSFLLVSMTPVWLSRILFRWRLSNSTVHLPPPKLSIGSLLAITAFIATAVAGQRAYFSMSQADASLDRSIASVLIPHLVIMFVAMFVQFAGLWTLLRIRSTLRAAGLAAIPLLIAPLAAFVAASASAMQAAEPLVLLSFTIAGLFSVGYLHLYLLRIAGYRIYAGQPATQSDDTFKKLWAEAEL